MHSSGVSCHQNICIGNDLKRLRPTRVSKMHVDWPFGRFREPHSQVLFSRTAQEVHWLPPRLKPLDDVGPMRLWDGLSNVGGTQRQNHPSTTSVCPTQSCSTSASCDPYSRQPKSCLIAIG